MAIVSPGSDAFVSILNKIGGRHAIAAIRAESGEYQLSLIESDGDSRHLKTQGSVVALSANGVEDAVECLIESLALDSVPVLLKQSEEGGTEKWVWVDPATLEPHEIAGGPFEKAFHPI
jgi:hypothetical protein